MMTDTKTIIAVTATLATVALVRYKSQRSGYTKHDQRGPLSRDIASTIPYFPFKKLDKFYDIGGLLLNPTAFQSAIDVFVRRYRHMIDVEGVKIDKIAGIDARGFVLGPPIALALKLPFIMIRKSGKMPNAYTGGTYSKEYDGDDALAVQYHALEKGDNILLIDDLIATGGSMLAALDLVEHMGGHCVECACITIVEKLGARARIRDEGFSCVVWNLLDEEYITTNGLEDESIPTHAYCDDGKP